MKINLIRRELRPARVSSLPYIPLVALLLIAGIWLVSDFRGMSSARQQLKQLKGQQAQVNKQLDRYKALPRQKREADEDAERLRAKGALVTVLTRGQVSFALVLQALADATPAGLRLTQASFDPVRGETLLTGYGSEDKADFEVTTLLHALNANARVQETFSAARLMFCNGAKQGKRQVKKFSISMPYRKNAAATAAATAPKEAGV